MSEYHDDEQYDLFVHGTVFFDVVFTGLEFHARAVGTELQAVRGLGSCHGGIANLAIAASRLGVHTVPGRRVRRRCLRGLLLVDADRAGGRRPDVPHAGSPNGTLR